MTFGISLDIETLSTHKNAVVLSIGACTLSLTNEPRNTFHVLVDAQSQIDAGRHVSFDTLKWWIYQQQEARDAAFEGERMPIDTALTSLRLWMANFGDAPVWTKGPGFDGAILESLAETNGLQPAWHFRNHRDVRTIEDAVQRSHDDQLYERFYQVVSKARTKGVAHNALDDAISQGAVVEWWYKELEA